MINTDVLQKVLGSLIRCKLNINSLKLCHKKFSEEKILEIAQENKWSILCPTISDRSM